jgi:heptosyltransferase-2/heptosyltransferase-3
MNMLKAKLSAADPSLLTSQFALFHPTAAFATKQWPVENFARAAEFLHDRGVSTIAVAAGNEQSVLAELIAESKVEVLTRNDLSLPEITALASRAALFVGNDSGIAHIAAAVGTPAVVIFGSSNIDHWRPWTDAANEVVFQPFECQPCPGYVCRVFGDPKCIKSVNVRTVTEAIDRVLQIAEKGS